MKVAHLITSKIFAGIEQHVFELAQATRLEIDHIILCDKAWLLTLLTSQLMR